MRIATLSDLHLGKKSWKNFAQRKIKEVVSLKEIDVLYFGGDLAEPDKENPERGWDNFKRGLELLAASSAPVKLFTLGNNDLEQLQDAVLTDHYGEMKRRVGEYGFHLLEDGPFIHEEIAFVGNVGWSDGTLWTPFAGKTTFPNSVETIRTRENLYFNGLTRKQAEDLTSIDFYNHCRTRIKRDLDRVEKNDNVWGVIVGIHFVPDKSFVRSSSSKFNYRNWYMGAEGHAEHYQRRKVIGGFTGHTHRSGMERIGKCDVYNISGDQQPQIFEIRKREGKYDFEHTP